MRNVSLNIAMYSLDGTVESLYHLAMKINNK